VRLSDLVGIIKVRFVRPDGTRTPVFRITSTADSVGGSKVGVDEDGNAVVGWMQFDDSLDRWQTYVQRVSRTGRLSHARRISPTTVNGSEPVFAVAPNGEVLVNSTPFDTPGNAMSLLTRTNRLKPGPPLKRGMNGGTPVACPDGSFVVMTLPPSSGSLAIPRPPAIEVNQKGRGVMAWGRPRPGAPQHHDVVARLVRRDGSLGHMHLLSKNAFGPQIGGLPHGEARVFYVSRGDFLMRAGR